MLETASKGLFCQLITIPLFKEHKILCQVAGHGSHTIKLLPTYVMTEQDCDWIVKAFDAVIAGSASRARARSGRSARPWSSTPCGRAPRARRRDFQRAFLGEPRLARRR